MFFEVADIFFVGEAAFFSPVFVMSTGVSYLTRETVGGIICASVGRTKTRRRRRGASSEHNRAKCGKVLLQQKNHNRSMHTNTLCARTRARVCVDRSPPDGR